LLKPDDPRRPASAQVLEQSERMADLDRKRPAILRGEITLADDGEMALFAEICQFKKLYASSVRYWLEAFSAKPQSAEDLTSGRRYNAACAAARAAAGQGEDAATVDEEQRTRWRELARQWLGADLALWTKRLESDRPESH